MIALLRGRFRSRRDGKRKTAIIVAIAIAYGGVKEIQACLRRNRTTTSMRAIS